MVSGCASPGRWPRASSCAAPQRSMWATASRSSSSKRTSSAASSISRARGERARGEFMPSDKRSSHPLAYLNESFLTSDEARPLRILAEYLEPLERFRRLHVRDTIVFFGSARLAEDGPLGRYYGEARELARLITLWSKGLPTHEHR